MPERVPSNFCPSFHKATELVGRRWTGAVVRALMGGPARFSELEAEIPGVSARMLAERLRELETEEIVAREVDAQASVRVTYQLTYKGRALGPVVEAIDSWAHDWVPKAGKKTHR